MIRLKNVRKKFYKENNTSHVVDISCLEIAAGEKVALVGESGSGKTTLLNLVSGLVNADSGEININGQDICQLSEARRDKFRANNIGYLFQSFHLLDGYTALENVELGMLFADGAAKREHAKLELSRLGLDNRLHHYPGQLSMGQQARVALARAIANHPQLILADEPTGALDTSTAGEVLDLLFEKNAEHNATLICATHDKGLAAKFDRIITTTELQ
ncbi:MAG: ABC transporter ATP-binding protein [Planctomycetota bacterium]|jgi:putative ABC transport system ATP-binding protein|nr:ABC transporter ATP-binding protein [Planctomycetota bacterium]